MNLYLPLKNHYDVFKSAKGLPPGPLKLEVVSAHVHVLRKAEGIVRTGNILNQNREYFVIK